MKSMFKELNRVQFYALLAKCNLLADEVKRASASLDTVALYNAVDDLKAQTNILRKHFAAIAVKQGKAV